MISTLEIISWNANGLLSRKQEFQAILDINKIEICLIFEIPSTKQLVVNFRRYINYHSSSKKMPHKGRCAVIFKEHNLDYEKIKFRAEEIEDIKSTSVSLTSKNRNIITVNLYGVCHKSVGPVFISAS